jgi:hypothetical protein
MTDQQSPPEVRVRFRRSGGFAGTSLRTDIDSSSQDAAAEEARAILARINLGALPASSSRSGQADAFQYDIDVFHGDSRRHLLYTDQDLPEELQPLVAVLTRRARSR